MRSIFLPTLLIVTVLLQGSNDVQAQEGSLTSQESWVDSPAGQNIANDAVYETMRNTVQTFKSIEASSAGVLRSCGVEYTIVGRDSAYKDGAVVVLNGSININYAKAKQAVFMSLKVRGLDMDLTTQQMTPFEIPYAYLRTFAVSTAGRHFTTFQCENGGFCSATVDNTDDVTAGLLSHDLAVVYQRDSLGIDAAVEFDTTVDPSEKELFSSLVECLGRLSDVIEGPIR
jgi:hypothetical protein